MVKRKTDIIKIVKKNFKFLLLGLILLVIFHRHIVMIGAILIFLYLGMITQALSRLVPHISIETISPCAILLGYLYGWPVGLGFGLIAGMFTFMNAGLLNLTVLIVCSFMGLLGVLGNLFAQLNFPFWQAYLLSYTIRMFSLYFVMKIVGQDPFENIAHSFIESGYNMVVVIHFMIIFYNIMTALGG